MAGTKKAARKAGASATVASETLIDVDRLRKSFGSVAAVDGVSFKVDRGEVLGFLGPNGAGKSTTMKIITGFLSATSGDARICGADVRVDPREVKRRIGYLPEGAPLYGDMTPEGFLDFCASVRGLSGAKKRRAVDEVIQRIELGEVLHRRIDTLSKGFKRRLGLAQSLVHDPEVLILDEPTDGLDPNQKHAVRTLLSEISPKKAIIISTHLLEEVDAICDRAIIIDHGRLVGSGTPAELRASAPNHNAVVMRLDASAALRASEIVMAMPQVRAIERNDAGSVATLTALPRDGAFIADIVASQLRAQNVAFYELHTEEGRLDDVFRQLTTGAEHG